MADDFIVVFVTAGSPEEAERIAEGLVSDRLAACVNIVPAVRSLYVWEGNLCREGETLLVIKSRMARWEALAARVRELHSYQVPEIIALPIAAGSGDYLRWVEERVRESEG